MHNPENSKEDFRYQRTRQIGLRGIGIDSMGVVRFAGEVGGPPESNELSGEQLEAYERREAKVMNDLYDIFRDSGRSHKEAKNLAGID